MEKLTIRSANRNTLHFIPNRVSMKSEEAILLPKRLFQRFSSEVALFLMNFHRRRWERYEHNLETGGQQSRGVSAHTSNSRRKQLTISKSIVEAVLLKLKVFEQQKGFLSTEVSLNSLAGQLQTNSSYLSKIINHTKGKSFKSYLNDLRVAHAYEELRDHPEIRKFTIEAIANDFGFKSAESFSKKFSEVYGVYPSKFLRELGKRC